MKTCFRLLLVLLLLLPYTASYSESSGRLSVSNETGKYLHVIVNGVPYLYVGPGGTVSVPSDAGSQVVYAFYAPGQEITGSADTVLAIYRIESMVGGCNSQSSNTCSCSSAPESQNSVSYTSAKWTVKPETLAGGAQ